VKATHLFILYTSSMKHTTTEENQSMYCLVRFNGYLNPDWQQCLGNLEITHEITGSTLLSGQLLDQAALYGVLLTIRRLGLTLLSLETREALPHVRVSGTQA
jgi:hypothetical protein